MNIGIILAGGSGKRLGSDRPKQFLEFDGKPLIYRSIKAFSESDADEIVIVSKKEYVDYLLCEVVRKYSFDKVSAVIEGGKERYDSVCNALLHIRGRYGDAEGINVAIHDGARPFVTSKLINESFRTADECGACIAAVPSKDTVKLCDDSGFVLQTLKRNHTYIVQTPQTFKFNIIEKAFEEWRKTGDSDITDDAMMVERYTDVKVKIIEGDYANIKITTVEDLKALT